MIRTDGRIRQFERRNLEVGDLSARPSSFTPMRIRRINSLSDISALMFSPESGGFGIYGVGTS